MNAERLLAHYERIADAPDAIARLRRFILDLAVRGKLVEQDANDEPASELLKRIAAEKARLVKAGKVRKTKRSSSTDDDFLLFGSPPGWVWSRLGGLSRKIHYGFTASANQNIDAVRLLRITDIQNSRVKWNSVPGCEIDEKALPKFKLETGDILIARTGGTIGKSFLVTGLPCVVVFASYLIRVQGSKEIYARYLKLFFDSPIYWMQLREGVRGAGQPNVNGQMLDKMQVPLPPLAEQHRIVVKVDELMALCDRLEAERTEREATRDRLASASLARLNTPDPDPVTFLNHAAFALNNLTPLTTCLDQIKALRQTILNLAVRGKLVEQDPNDEPASELLKRIAAEKARLVKAVEIKKKPKRLEFPEVDDTDFCIPSSWHWTRLGEITSYIQRGKSPKYASENGSLVVSQKCVQWRGLDLNVARKITRDSLTTYEDIRFLRKGDLLWNSTGTGTIGRIIRLIEPPEKLVCDSHVTVVRCLFVYPEYVRTWLWSDNVYGLIEERAAGSTNQVELTAQMAISQLVPLPPLAEQHRIVARVDELMALCDRLETSLSTGDDTRRRLLDALLHEALAPSEEESGSIISIIAQKRAGQTARATQSAD